MTYSLAAHDMRILDTAAHRLNMLITDEVIDLNAIIVAAEAFSGQYRYMNYVATTERGADFAAELLGDNLSDWKLDWQRAADRGVYLPVL